MIPWIVLGIGAAIVLFAWAASSSNGGTSVPSALANAVSIAEGLPVAGSVPQRANNPGDLELGDQGQGTIGGKTIFASLEDGWAALERELELITSGTSPVYNSYAQSLGLQDSSQLSISQVAQKYTGGDNPDAWANTVASELGVTPDTAIGDVSA